MLFTNLILASCGLSLVQAHYGHGRPHDAQQSLAVPQGPIKRVAIIGAGSAGASTAYHLRQYASAADLPVNITVFERNAYIGGRSTTVNVHSDPAQPAELGASIFVSVNRILIDAADRFNLSTAVLRRRDDGGAMGQVQGKGKRQAQQAPELGIWNGASFVLTTSATSSWWDTAKLLWRYGLAPIRTRNLMKSTVGKFLKMYEEPYFPWASLSGVAYDLGLTAATAATGAQFLEESGIGTLFAGEVVQASTRVNYAQNLPLIHGLETMVCMATDGAMAVEGGNWQIFAHMIDAATADVRLNTSVTSIQRRQDGSSSGGYIVSSKGPPAAAEAADAATVSETSDDVFDTVILAAPHQFSSLTLPSSLPTPDAQPYVQLHVTLFTSPHLLSPQAFNLPPGTPVPQVVLTTLAPDEHPGASQDGVGKAGFWSISTLRPVVNPGTGEGEWLYKIFSPRRVDAGFLGRILGVEVDASAGSSDEGEDEGEEGEGEAVDGIAKEDVSWIYRKTWHSYPYLYPRVTFQEMKLDEEGGLWYTAGIEGFISTMETSALMGMNVARLIVDGWLKEGDGEVDGYARMGGDT